MADPGWGAGPGGGGRPPGTNGIGVRALYGDTLGTDEQDGLALVGGDPLAAALRMAAAGATGGASGAGAADGKVQPLPEAKDWDDEDIDVDDMTDDEEGNKISPAAKTAAAAAPKPGVAAGVVAAAAAAAAQYVPPPNLTPAEAAREARRVQQEALGLTFLDFGEGAQEEDIMQLSEVFGYMKKYLEEAHREHACMDSSYEQRKQAAAARAATLRAQAAAAAAAAAAEAAEQQQQAPEEEEVDDVELIKARDLQALINARNVPGLEEAATDVITDHDVVAAAKVVRYAGPAAVMLKAAQGREAAQQLQRTTEGTDADEDVDLGTDLQFTSSRRGRSAGAMAAVAGTASAGDADGGARRGRTGHGAVPLPVAAAEVVVHGDDDWESAVVWGEPSGGVAVLGGSSSVSAALKARKGTQQQQQHPLLDSDEGGEEAPTDKVAAAAAAAGDSIAASAQGGADGGAAMEVDGAASQPALDLQTAAEDGHPPSGRGALAPPSLEPGEQLLHRFPLPAGNAAPGALGRLGRPRRPHNPKAPPLHPRMLRLAPQPHQVSAQPRKHKGAKGAKDAAGAAARGAPGSAAAPRGAQQRQDAAGRPQGPQLLHAGVLLSRRFLPGLNDDDWAEDVIWDAGDATAASGQLPARLAPHGEGALSALLAGGAAAAAAGRRRVAPVVWDLNDPCMVFECDRAGAYEEAEALVRAPPPRRAIPLPPHLGNDPDPIARELAFLNISKDHLYHAVKKGRGDKAPLIKHSVLASNLTTIPIASVEASNPVRWHRPLAVWCARDLHTVLQKMDSGRKQPGNSTFRVRFRSLNNRVIPVSLPEEEVDNATTLATFWDHARGRFNESQSRKKGDQPQPGESLEEPLLFGGLPGQCRRLKAEATLADLHVWQGLGLGPSTLTVIPVWRQLHALPTAACNKIPDASSGLPVRPPGAFKTKQQLSASDGHVLLLEHFEERPMFMLHMGMGARLSTYYRKRGDDDTGYAELAAELRSARQEGRVLPPTSAEPPPPGAPRLHWMIGTTHALDPDAPSPFLDLGHIAPGAAQFAVDAGCYRAPAAPHAASSSDFLLVRSANSGALQLREITGAVLVGQQHPQAPVWAPGSPEAVRFEESRLQAYVRRCLANAQQRLEKRGEAAGPPQATISLSELVGKFSRTGLTGKEGAIQKLLTEECECVPVGDGSEYALRPDAKQLSEAELRKLVTPELCARYEALHAGIGFRNSAGLSAAALAEMEAIREKAPEKLGVALEQLPLHSEGRQAAAIIEMALVAAPWHLSEAYQAVLREGRTGVLLALTGIGDPTGRGRGFSFVREDARRLAREEAKPAEGLSRREDGTITGTDADLRKLPHARAGELLRTKFGMTQDEVDGLGRWARIDAIRTKCRDSQFAEMVAADPELSQYVRGVRVKHAEQQAKLRQEASKIYAAQMDAINEDWDQEAASDQDGETWAQQDPFADELVHTGRGAHLAAAAAAARAEAAAAAAGAALDEELAEFMAIQQGKGGAAGGAAAAAAAAGGALQGADGKPKAPLLPAHLRPKLEAVPGERRVRRIIRYPPWAARPYGTTRVIIYKGEKAVALNALCGQKEGFGERTIKPREGGVGPKRRAQRPSALEPLHQEAATGLEAVAQKAEREEEEERERRRLAALAEQQAAAAAQAAAQQQLYGGGGGGGGGGVAKKRAGGGKPGGDDEWAPPALPGPPPRAGGGGASHGLKKGGKKGGFGGSKKGGGGGGGSGGGGSGGKKRGRDKFVVDDDDLDVSDSEDDGNFDYSSEPEPTPEPGSDEDGSPRAKRARGGAGAGAGSYSAPGDGGGGGGGSGGPERRPLAHILRYVVGEVVKWQKLDANVLLKGFRNIFKDQVRKTTVSDYNEWVKPEDEMWLEKVRARIGKHYYATAAAFIADLDQIRINAEAYNTPGHGRCRAPEVPGIAANMVAFARSLLSAQQAEVDHAEALAAAGPADHAAPSAALTAAQQAEVAAAAAVEAARGDPAAYSAALRKALEDARTLAAAGRQDAPPGWEWVGCDACSNWRLVPGGFYREKGFAEGGASFVCADNAERPGASCAEPNDWPEEEAEGDGGGGGGAQDGGEDEEDVWEEIV